MSTTVAAFNVLETTIDDIHSAYKSGQLTARQRNWQIHDQLQRVGSMPMLGTE
jgi:hypothetical protein